MTLFDTLNNPHIPLATRMRPSNLQQFVGQTHLLSPTKPLRQSIEKKLLHSMILWGPPGTGKTTLAKLIAHQTNATFQCLSAIFSGVKDIRQVVEKAQSSAQPTVLFVDEIHRFNKAQQDIFLPFIEQGTLTLIGATTENPSFELNNALLSRTRVYVLKRLTIDELRQLLHQALQDNVNGLGRMRIQFPENLQDILIQAADGDGRQLLNTLEILVDALPHDTPKITETLLAEVLQTNLRRFDKQGDLFYDQISALHKAIRGSSPDAALYWFCRILDGGGDPRYVSRRLLRIASEDVGLADPRALEIALHADAAYERLGSPEGELALAQAVLYLSCASKSNATYVAFQNAMHAAKQHGTLPVPSHLCNAPTALMQQLGHAKTYRYAHDEPHAYAAGVHYFPDTLFTQHYYQPTSRGLEEKIAARLAQLRALDEHSKFDKNPSFYK
jgi:putative ATPase